MAIVISRPHLRPDQPRDVRAAVDLAARRYGGGDGLLLVTQPLAHRGPLVKQAEHSGKDLDPCPVGNR